MPRPCKLALLTGLSLGLSTLVMSSRALSQQGPGPGPGQVPGGVPGSMPMPPGMPGMGGGPGNPVMILLAPSVQKELKLTDQQKSKIYSLARSAGQKGRELMQSMLLAQAQGNTNPQAMMQAGLQLRQEAEQAAAKVLDPKQKERFDQISLRAEGPLAVARPDIAAKLRLNSNQTEYVQGIMAQMRQELFLAIRQGAANGQVDPGQIRVVANRLREGAVREISKVIDRKQKDAFNKMLGEPFDVSKIESEMLSVAPTLASPPGPDSAPSNPSDPSQGPDGPAQKKDRSRSGSNP